MQQVNNITWHLIGFVRSARCGIDRASARYHDNLYIPFVWVHNSLSNFNFQAASRLTRSKVIHSEGNPWPVDKKDDYDYSFFNNTAFLHLKSYSTTFAQVLDSDWLSPKTYHSSASLDYLYNLPFLASPCRFLLDNPKLAHNLELFKPSLTEHKEHLIYKDCEETNSNGAEDGGTPRADSAEWQTLTIVDSFHKVSYIVFFQVVKIKQYER